jgi:Protein of unknown function (DUF559)
MDAQPFSVGAATRAGVGRSRLNGGDLARPFWGVRVPLVSGRSGAPSTTEDLCRAIALRMPPGAFFTHVTAAQLMRLPLPFPMTASRPIHVGVVSPQRAMDARGVNGHRMKIGNDDLHVWNGFTVTSPSRTWLDLAHRLSLFELVAMGDYLIHWERPLTTLAALTDAASRNAGRRGMATVRAALPLLRTRSESPRESVLRVIIVVSGLPEPECNLNIFDPSGRFLARADLAYPQFKLMLEYQGDQHRTDRAQWRHDIRRVGGVEDHGWQVLQFTDDDLQDPAALVARILRRLRGRGWTGTVAGGLSLPR